MYRRKEEIFRVRTENKNCKSADFKSLPIVIFSKWKLASLLFLLPFFLFFLQIPENHLRSSTLSPTEHESTLQDYSTKRTLSEHATYIKEILVSLPFAKTNNFTQTLQKTSVRQLNTSSFKASITATDTQLRIFFKNYCKKNAPIAKVIPHHIDYYIFSLCKITT